MRAIETLEHEEAVRVQGLLFDLDDTVLDHGVLGPEAFRALARLRTSGLSMVAVTGRPVSWAQVLVRQWQLDGMVAENGNIAVARGDHGLKLIDRLNHRQRRERQRELQDLGEALVRHWPELVPSDAGIGRVTDIAFDIAEQRRVDPSVVALASAFAHDAGARTSLSSIHLHVTFDVDDKATGALRFLRSVYGIDPAHACARFAFIGDSGNDGPAFAGFRTSIAVRNLSGRCTIPPRFVTKEAFGAGFAEAVDHLLDARSR